MNPISVTRNKDQISLPATADTAAAKDRSVHSAAPAPQPEPSAKVTISNAATAALAAARAETLETPQQTAREARGNDHQAQRLVAKEAALKS